MNLTGAKGIALAPGIPSELPFGEAKKRTVENFERDYLLRALRENEGKGGWKDCELEYLRKRVHQEVDEFIGSLGGGGDVLSPNA